MGSSDFPRRIDLTQELEELQQSDPELYEKARIFGARNELYYILMRKGWNTEKARVVFKLKTWEELSDFVERNNIQESEDLDSDLLTLEWFKQLKADPTLWNKYD